MIHTRTRLSVQALGATRGVCATTGHTMYRRESTVKVILTACPVRPHNPL
jgi:hypothetical protein